MMGFLGSRHLLVRIICIYQGFIWECNSGGIPANGIMSENTNEHVIVVHRYLAFIRL